MTLSDVLSMLVDAGLITIRNDQMIEEELESNGLSLDTMLVEDKDNENW
jgi:hypothetical protein